MKRVKILDWKKYLVDLILVLVSFFCIGLLYLGFIEKMTFADFKYWLVPVFLVYFYVFYTLFNQYNTIWKYYSLRSLVHGTFAMLLTAGCFMLTVYLALRVFGNDPKWIQYVIYSAVCCMMVYVVVSCSRIFWRWLYMKRTPNEEFNKKRRLAIVGGGRACVMLVEYLKGMGSTEYELVCIFDDDKAKIGHRIDDVKVFGSIASIPDKCKELSIDELIIAMPSVKGERMKEIIDICVSAKVIVNTMPVLGEIRRDKGANIMSQVRKIKPEDLLGRNTIQLDKTSVATYVKDQVVLVSGGGGSIGSELCRQVAALSPKTLVVMDIYENSAYELQQELVRKYGDSLDLHVEIATMCDLSEMEELFEKYRPNIVFHAAAHKHVPLMETNPAEAVKNNIFGTYNIVNCADRYGAKKFIQISTDKAVNPTNVMGATKRFCEMIVQSMKNKSKTQYTAVRFGNVLGSNGSVIPLFKKQIENGGPVTVTHPEMQRYFMTIPEAVQLVMLAGVEAESGNVYVLDMGTMVKIDDFARKMIMLAGLVPGKDIKIEYTGLRPGEKLYEELIMDDDRVDKTKLDRVFIEKLPEITAETVSEGMDLLAKAIAVGERGAVVHALSQVVDTYHPDDKMQEVIKEYVEKH